MNKSLLAFLSIFFCVCPTKGQDAKLSGTVIGTEKSASTSIDFSKSYQIFNLSG